MAGALEVLGGELPGWGGGALCSNGERSDVSDETEDGALEVWLRRRGVGLARSDVCLMGRDV